MLRAVSMPRRVRAEEGEGAASACRACTGTMKMRACRRMEAGERQPRGVHATTEDGSAVVEFCEGLMRQERCNGCVGWSTRAHYAHVFRRAHGGRRATGLQVGVRDTQKEVGKTRTRTGAWGRTPEPCLPPPFAQCSESALMTFSRCTLLLPILFPSLPSHTPSRRPRRQTTTPCHPDEWSVSARAPDRCAVHLHPRRVPSCVAPVMDVSLAYKHQIVHVLWGGCELGRRMRVGGDR
jgi:hypothetical protein